LQVNEGNGAPMGRFRNPKEGRSGLNPEDVRRFIGDSWSQERASDVRRAVEQRFDVDTAPDFGAAQTAEEAVQNVVEKATPHLYDD
jgi:hypothetical protein